MPDSDKKPRPFRRCHWPDDGTEPPPSPGKGTGKEPHDKPPQPPEPQRRADQRRVEESAPYVATIEYELCGRRLRRTFRAPTAAAALDGLLQLLDFGAGSHDGQPNTGNGAVA